MIQRVDLHLHTRFSDWKHLRIIKPRDSYNEPIEVYRRCKRLGHDFVAITDHDTIEGALDLLSRHPDLEPEIIVGEEVESRFPDTGQWVHVNVFDIDETIHDDISRAKENVHDLVAYLKRHRIFHVLNHPFQSYRVQKRPRAYIEDILALFDHFEVSNATLPPRHNDAVARMLEYAASLYAHKSGVGGSDAHVLRGIGRYVTEIETDSPLDKNEWLRAVSRGESRVTGSAVGAIAVTANVYRIIGQYYLSLRDAAVRRTMKPHNLLAAALLAPACIAGLPAFLNLANSLKLEAVSACLLRSLRRMRTARADDLPSPDLIGDPLD